jgi:hypothetical protein
MFFNDVKLRGITHKMMKLTTSQIQRLSEKILAQWKSQNLITFKVDEKVVLQAVKDVITADFKREEQLDQDARAMADQIASEHGDNMQAGKMFPMLKQKLAKERKIIL